MVLKKSDVYFEETPLWVRQQKDGQLEPQMAYYYFTMFLNLDKPRNIPKLHKELLEDGRNVSIQKLRNYSSLWGWYARVGAYDEYIQEKRLERTLKINNDLMDMRNDWILEHIHNLEDRLTFCNNNMSIITKEIEKLTDRDGEEVDLKLVKKLNELLVVNNKTYNEISDKLLGIYKDKYEKDIIITNDLNNNDSLKNFQKELNKFIQ